jgi:hypothetical protein
MWLHGATSVDNYLLNQSPTRRLSLGVVSGKQIKPKEKNNENKS